MPSSEQIYPTALRKLPIAVLSAAHSDLEGLQSRHRKVPSHLDSSSVCIFNTLPGDSDAWGLHVVYSKSVGKWPACTCACSHTADNIHLYSAPFFGLYREISDFE